MATHRSYVCSCFAMFFNSAFYSNHVLPSSRSRFVSLDMYYPSVVAIVCGSGPWLCPSVLDLLSSSSPNGFFYSSDEGTSSMPERPSRFFQRMQESASSALFELEQQKVQTTTYRKWTLWRLAQVCQFLHFVKFPKPNNLFISSIHHFTRLLSRGSSPDYTQESVKYERTHSNEYEFGELLLFSTSEGVLRKAQHKNVILQSILMEVTRRRSTDAKLPVAESALTQTNAW